MGKMIIGKSVVVDVNRYIDVLMDSNNDLVRMSIANSEWNRRYKVVWEPVWESVVNLVYNTLDDTIDV
jgi:hypothetical protein